ncbi:hypothetical protein EW145_g6709 [Phellinidium pouzarii]|uniref:Uncharacterized protein n=1 Tax=Phellinidium pouzarii TaxID=167371 RepID=A0A4S4KWD9_9AGAM|nr:hypothetical protein EW145_g6709 [Phellinidium pouzarii]
MDATDKVSILAVIDRIQVRTHATHLIALLLMGPRQAYSSSVNRFNVRDRYSRPKGCSTSSPSKIGECLHGQSYDGGGTFAYVSLKAEKKHRNQLLATDLSLKQTPVCVNAIAPSVFPSHFSGTAGRLETYTKTTMSALQPTQGGILEGTDVLPQS